MGDIMILSPDIFRNLICLRRIKSVLMDKEWEKVRKTLCIRIYLFQIFIFYLIFLVTIWYNSSIGYFVTICAK